MTTTEKKVQTFELTNKSIIDLYNYSKIFNLYTNFSSDEEKAKFTRANIPWFKGMGINFLIKPKQRGYDFYVDNIIKDLDGKHNLFTAYGYHKLATQLKNHLGDLINYYIQGLLKEEPKYKAEIERIKKQGKGEFVGEVVIGKYNTYSSYSYGFKELFGISNFLKRLDESKIDIYKHPKSLTDLTSELSKSGFSIAKTNLFSLLKEYGYNDDYIEENLREFLSKTTRETFNIEYGTIENGKININERVKFIFNPDSALVQKKINPTTKEISLEYNLEAIIITYLKFASILKENENAFKKMKDEIKLFDELISGRYKGEITPRNKAGYYDGIIDNNLKNLFRKNINCGLKKEETEEISNIFYNNKNEPKYFFKHLFEKFNIGYEDVNNFFSSRRNYIQQKSNVLISGDLYNTFEKETEEFKILDIYKDDKK